jgi:GIY-YIG catalytic domain-containing protein
MTSVIARPHALYRFFAADDSLLYIGITNDLGARFTGHSGDKDWWVAVVRVAVEHFPDRRSVLDAERAAIVAEKPRYNVQYNEAVTLADDPWAVEVEPSYKPATGLVEVGDTLAIGTRFGDAFFGRVSFVDARGVRLAQVGDYGWYLGTPCVVMWDQVAEIHHGHKGELARWVSEWRDAHLPQFECPECHDRFFVTYRRSGMCGKCWNEQVPF